jgi:hypothetical protein
MKKILLFILVIGINVAFSQNTEWHVKPLNHGGSPSGDGSETNPWDLETALNINVGLSTPIIKGGDTVWLHNVPGYNYVGRFTCPLAGSITGSTINYITISSYPGEWAIIDGNTVGTTTDPAPNICPVANSQPEEFENIIYQEDLSTYDDDDELDVDPVLDVTGGYLIFKDFQVCFTGNYNRRLLDSNPSIFHKITGINHSPDTANAGKKSKFINLVVKNVPGVGLGSWKGAADSEIYGCIIYNNGYIRFNSDEADVNGVYKVFGKGPGIYTQNSSTGANPRLIKNNIVHNNYDSGVLVWSATTNPTTDYIRNYELCDNIIFNNANPGRRHNINDISTSTDARPGMIIDSGTGNAHNRPTDINVHNNVFYLNAVNYIGALRVNKTNNVNIHDNLLCKGTKTCSFTLDNTSLAFTNNLYWGKFLEFGANVNSYTTNNWNFNNNKYYISDDFTNVMCHIPTSPTDPTQIRRSFATFRSIYTTAETTYSYRDLEYGGPNMYYINGSTLPTFNFNIKVIQNVYNPKLFYVTIFNAKPNLYSSAPVNFSSYNIPDGSPYIIKDVQNYANSSIPGTFDVNNPSINFSLTLSGTESPIGYYEDITCSQFTKLKDFATFTIEFNSCNGIDYQKTVSNVTETSTVSMLVKTKIKLGTNYVTNSGSDVTAKAGKEVLLTGTCQLKSGSNVLLRIEDPCPDLAYTGDINSKMSTSNDGVKAVKEVEVTDNLIIYPNPSSGVFKIESSKGLKIKQITASDINNARFVFNQNYDNETTVEIDISSHPQGIYVVNVLFEDGSQETQKIIKK